MQQCKFGFSHPKASAYLPFVVYLLFSFSRLYTSEVCCHLYSCLSINPYYDKILNQNRKYIYIYIYKLRDFYMTNFKSPNGVQQVSKGDQRLMNYDQWTIVVWTGRAHTGFAIPCWSSSSTMVPSTWGRVGSASSALHHVIYLQPHPQRMRKREGGRKKKNEGGGRIWFQGFHFSTLKSNINRHEVLRKRESLYISINELWSIIFLIRPFGYKLYIVI